MFCLTLDKWQILIFWLGMADVKCINLTPLPLSFPIVKLPYVDHSCGLCYVLGRNYSYNVWAPDNNEVLNNVRPSPPSRSRGGRGDGSLRAEMQGLRSQMRELAQLCTNMSQQQQANHEQEQGWCFIWVDCFLPHPTSPTHMFMILKAGLTVSPLWVILYGLL